MMSLNLEPRPGILNIKPYVGGEDIVPPGCQAKVLLSSNENPFGPSPRVLQTIQEQSLRAHIYPSGTSRKTRKAIGEFHGLDPDRIICTNGSEEGLTLLIRAYAGAGDEVLFSRHAFSLYGIVTQAVGGIPVAAETCNYNIDVDALLASVTGRTKLVILDNPRNPIGSFIGRAELIRLRENLPEHILLVLDSAYAEYMSLPEYTSGIDLVEAYQNVVMTRTFSKFYALAGLRLGWMYASPTVVDVINRIRAPFCCNHLAQEAGIAALSDTKHHSIVKAHNDETLPWFMNELERLGLSYVSSVTNFVLAEFDAEGPLNADNVYLYLARAGYIVRPVKGYGLPHHLRITMGLRDDLQSVLSLLGSFLHDTLPNYGINA